MYNHLANLFDKTKYEFIKLIICVFYRMRFKQNREADVTLNIIVTFIIIYNSNFL